MSKLILFYDNWCPNCSNFVKTIKKNDFFNKIDVVELRKVLENRLNYIALDEKLAKKQMASYSNLKYSYGYDSIFEIFKRIPHFWFLLPLLYFFKITKLGQNIYLTLAINRKIIPIHCDKNCQI